MSTSEPLILQLGSGPQSGARTEDFFEGRLRIRSRDGLHASERAILPQLPRGKTGRALVIDSRYAVLGFALRVLNPELEIHCHYMDSWSAGRARDMLAGHPEKRLTIGVAGDPPPGPWQMVVLPLEKQGIADLVREYVRRAAAEWLASGGLLYSSSDTRDDRFVRDEIKKAFGALHIAPEEKRHGGVGYVARRPAKVLASPPRSTTTFEIHEDDRTLTFESRLGVFCCDRLDPGTRALLALADVSGAGRILDLGCGSGLVGIVAGLRAPEASLTFLDSNARATESAQRNVELYGMHERSRIILSADPLSDLRSEAPFDCILTNPPYYGNWRIAELFLETAGKYLAPGGTLQIVTKAADWYLPQLSRLYRPVHEEKRGGYTVLRAVRAR